jgi:hypothetical protein
MKAATKPALARKPPIRIAVVEGDPLRFVGFRALFDSETDFELISATRKCRSRAAGQSWQPKPV